MLTNGFLVRNLRVGSPGNGNGRLTPDDKIGESRNGVAVIDTAALLGLYPRGDCAGKFPDERESGTGVNHANGLSLLVQVGEWESLSKFACPCCCCCCCCW